MTTTLNKDEVAKFSKIADKWWDESGEFGILHVINPLRIRFIKDNISSLGHKDFSKLKLLDVGCGGGLVSVPMSRLGFDVTAIDASPENIATCQVYANDNGLDINFRHCLVEDLQQETFDVILALEIIEHVENPGSFLKYLAPLLKPKGILIVSTLNKNLKSLLLGKIAAEYLLNLVPKGTHQWSKFISPSDLATSLHALDLTPLISKGITLNPLSQRWELSDDLSVNYISAFLKDSIQEN
jgi:2-polyprenyl-6-hydroxyphenyl methylase/3-demethylubiquinone-9 3-methyltransferase